MRDEGASRRRTGLHRDGAHVSIISVVAIVMMKANVNTKVDTVILWIPPASVHNLICICRGINWAIRDTIIHTIMTVIKDKGAQAIRPVTTAASITHSRLWRRRPWRRGRGTVLVCNIASKSNDAIIECIVWRGMIEDGLF